MKLAPTMSKSALLLQCAWPFDPERELPEDEAGEPADYGTAFHALLARGCLSRFKNQPTKAFIAEQAEKHNLFAPELAAHYASAWPVLESWLTGEGEHANPWGANFLKGSLQVEVSRAFDVETGNSREIEGPGEHHVYPDIRPGEIVGTADLVIETADFILVDDHKTGQGDFSSPALNPQILSLACAFGYHSSKRIIGAISHFPRGGLPQVFAEEFGAALDVHRAQMRAAVRRIGDGSLRTGSSCKYCPARGICPTRDANMIEAITVAGGIIRQGPSAVTTAEKVGQLHELLAEIEYRAIPRARDEIRAWVRAHPTEIATRPDGKVLAFVKRARETLSKSSIVKALGKVGGEKEIARLRGLKCLTESEREELHAVDNE